MAQVEVCVYSVHSAIQAERGGACRVELCENLTEGGTTPGPGLIRRVRSNLRIPVHVMIRPRGGDFLYSAEEFEVMKEDILFCRENGVDGIVFGIVDATGRLDGHRTMELIELAKPLKITLHRVFDTLKDPLSGLHQAIELGFHRILTSGQAPAAEQGIPRLKKLVTRAAGRIIIMPGGGIRESNIQKILRETGAPEIHVSARERRTSQMIYRKPGIRLTGRFDISDYEWYESGEASVRTLVQLASS